MICFTHLTEEAGVCKIILLPLTFVGKAGVTVVLEQYRFVLLYFYLGYSLESIYFYRYAVVITVHEVL
jgi:hypothetical protein